MTQHLGLCVASVRKLCHAMGADTAHGHCSPLGKTAQRAGLGPDLSPTQSGREGQCGAVTILPRIPYQTQQAIIAERAKGRTDRQIEKILGLSHGLLGRPYRVDTTVEARAVEAGREHVAWQSREERRAEAWRRDFRAGDEERVRVQGWRPKSGDLVKGKPKPQAARPKG